VQLWARTMPGPESATRTAIERVNPNVLLGYLAVCYQPLAHIPSHDIQAYQAEVAADGLDPATHASAP